MGPLDSRHPFYHPFILMLLSIFSSIFFLLRVRATLLSATVITVPVTCREASALDGCDLRMHTYHKTPHANREAPWPLTFQYAQALEEQRLHACMHACIVSA